MEREKEREKQHKKVIQWGERQMEIQSLERRQPEEYIETRARNNV